MVIGGGPAGYAAALRAAEAGARPVLVEAAEVGGTCLNRGCIPTKAWLDGVSVLDTIRRAPEFGVKVADVTVDAVAMAARVARLVGELRQGLAELLRSQGVRLVRGRARFLGPGHVVVEGDSGAEEWASPRIVIATGSREALPPVPGVDLPGVYTSEDLLFPERIPPSLVVVGGGPVGVEMATVYRALGAEVSLVEMCPQLVPGFDREMADLLAIALQDRGIKVLTGTRLEAIVCLPSGRLSVRVTGPGGAASLDASCVLLATGRRPFLEGLGLEKVGLTPGPGGELPVDEGMRTGVPGIFAAGDVVGGPMLAYVAFHQGMIAAENSLGLDGRRIDYRLVPRCVFSDPELAGVGLTEEQARSSGADVIVGRYPLLFSGRARAMGRADGLVKVVAERRYGEILGVHILGPRATDLIGEAAALMHLEGTLHDLRAIIHPHPSLCECLQEAGAIALAALSPGGKE